MNAQEFRETVVRQLGTIDEFMKTQARETKALHDEHAEIEKRVEDVEKQVFWYNRLGALIVLGLTTALAWLKLSVGKGN